MHTIRRSQFVRIDERFVADLRACRTVGRTFELTLFGRKLRVVGGKVERSLDHWTAANELLGTEGSVVMAVGPTGALAAHIEVAGKTFTIRPTGVGDLHVVHEHDLSQLGPECGTTSDVLRPSPPRGPMSNGQTYVDVCVFFTTRAMTNAGGEAAMKAEVHLRIAMANQANLATKVTNWKFRLVYTGETKFTEPLPLKLPTILGWFRSTNDNRMDEVHGIRKQYGGDLMSLIVDGAPRDWTGYAYCRSSASNAFSVTHREGLVSHLLHHEMGHNLGCAHNRANVDCSGSYSYSYGWRTPDNKYHTVMAYKAGSSQRINAWSGPGVRHNGYVMGTAKDDNGRTLVNRGPIVSNFLKPTVLDWCNLGGGIPGSLGLPVLEGSGTINRVAPLRITFDKVPVAAPGVLIVGGSELRLPVFGGVLVPQFDIAIVVRGDAVFDATFLSKLPSNTPVWFQAFFIDKGAVHGLSATDGVKTLVY